MVLPWMEFPENQSTSQTKPALKSAQVLQTGSASKQKKPAGQLTIGIGRDSRLSGPLIEMAVVKGLIHAGVKVVRCGLATTPAMFMSTVFDQTDFDGAVMITASHLPFNRNGLKFFDKDGGLDHEDITMVLEMSIEQDEKQIAKEITSNCQIVNLIEIYAEHLKNAICKQIGSTTLRSRKPYLHRTKNP